MCAALVDRHFHHDDRSASRMGIDICSNKRDTVCHRSGSLQIDPCFRCLKRVYPLERIDVGVLFHRGCFRCRVCNLQLTLRTYHWDQYNEPDIYCVSHVPKLVGTIDSESMGIKSAVNAPRGKNNINEQIRGSIYNPGWEYDANALEFCHHRDLNVQSRPFATYKDFERSGVFAAQNDLEQIQKVEEDLLYSTFRRNREKKIKKLEADLQQEKEKSVMELVNGFERIVSQNSSQNRLEEETKKLEEEYSMKKQSMMKDLLETMTSEERALVAQLIDKHSQQMLALITEKLSLKQDKKSDSGEGSEEEGVDLTRPPSPRPPEFRKSHLYDSPKVFEQIDNHVFAVAQKEHSTFTELVRDLTRNCHNELEKTRALYRWVTWKDLNKLQIDESVNPDSPYGLLRGIKLGTETYHDLFKRLGSYAGMFCEIIQGYSKGAGYKPGMKVEDSRFRNSWTSINIEGSWQFLNCNWGARHVRAHQNSSENLDQWELSEFNYTCDEFYFITEPEDHIYQHFPDDSRWQLLESPISMAEFLKLPLVKSTFFNYGLRFANHYDSIIITNHGVAIIELKMPVLLGFGYTLVPKSKNGDNAPVEGRTMLRIIGRKAIFTVAPPKPGKFYFTIFAKERWDSDSLQSACSFLVKCPEKEKVQRHSFPLVPFFGPTPSLSDFGLLPISHIDPFIVYEGEDLHFRFEINSFAKISHSLQFQGSTEATNIEDFNRFAFVRFRDETTISYQIRCPVRGFYVFSLFGCDRDVSGEETYDCIFRYLINCKFISKDRRPLPRACHRWFNCTLLDPQVGDINPDKRITFRVCVPAAVDIAMLIDDTWFHFRESSPGIWEGTVVAGRRACGAKIYAKLNRDKSRFSPLLEFRVK
ncbi:hillarin isoform X1 [Octopus bimaculoides]|uniref:hillarin isoform X1 n=1 Tax=Octopus bimaculoides TaxID=37653 RepID=UPI00071D8CDC|nr:hillarin isoform X1 [Octopus bimaculoides]|eukprot:XP_014779999.1 PREDICTED: kyphoscoliosis peptidase-like isoform X1 [Octopus bimaculoides]